MKLTSSCAFHNLYTMNWRDYIVSRPLWVENNEGLQRGTYKGKILVLLIVIFNIRYKFLFKKKKKLCQLLTLSKPDITLSLGFFIPGKCLCISIL